MLDLDPNNIRVVCEFENRAFVLEVTGHEMMGNTCARRLGVRIKHMDPHIIAQGVLNEHAAQLAASQQCDDRPL